LERHRAREVLADLRSLRPAELSDRLPNVDLPIFYGPVGGVEVEVTGLAGIREAVCELATEHGFPGDQPRSYVSFDASCARTLHSSMRMTPYEAAQEDVWTFFTLAILLDVAAWRFPGLPEDRVVGNPNRNAFRRLWWRAEILYEPGSEWTAFRGLGEDELVQIMERPTISGSPRVARAVMNVFADHVDANPDAPRMHVMRDATRRLIRLTPFVAIEALPDADLDALVDRTMRDSVSALSVSGSGLVRKAGANAPPAVSRGLEFGPPQSSGIRPAVDEAVGEARD
jgi:hypothetical protein